MKSIPEKNLLSIFTDLPFFGLNISLLFMDGDDDFKIVIFYE